MFFPSYLRILLRKATSLSEVFPGGSAVKNPPAIQESCVQSLGWEDPQEKGMATYAGILPWRIPRTKEPGGLQSTGSRRVKHD